MTPPASGAGWLAWPREALAGGGLSRAVVWLFVVLMTVGTVEPVTQNTAEVVLFIGLSALFLAWEVLRERLGQWGALVGVLIFAVGFALQWHLPLSLGVVLVVLVLPFRWGVPLAGLGILLLVGAWSQWYSGDIVLRSILALVQNVFLIYLLERVWINSQALRETRDELARTEIDTERTRLAGELNEVIGSTLRQVGLQTDEIRTRGGVEDPAFQRHLAEIADLVDRGLQQLELLSFEPVVGDFEAELDTAQALCRRLGVDFTASVEEIDDRVAEIFALMLRESITNMFKHATPTRCTVAARTEHGEAIFGFTNDGVLPHAPDSADGSGHRRWRRSLTELGGSLETSRLQGGRYQVRARVPVRAADPPAPRRPTTPTTAATPPTERITHG